MIRWGLLVPLIFSASTIHAANTRYVSKEMTDNDISAINQNFTNIENEFLNTVHKTSTETIRGYKYFGSTTTFAYSVYMATSSGKVGIGTNSPTRTLTVISPAATGSLVGNRFAITDSSTVTMELFQSSTKNQWRSNLGLGLAANNGSTDSIYISTNTNVGISNSNPTVPLDVTGKSAFSSTMTVSGGAFFAINSGTKVGIGTLNPSCTLEVVTPSASGSLTANRFALTDGASATMELQQSTSENQWRSNVALGLATNGSSTDSIYVSTNTMVGLGTASPLAPLHLNADPSSQGLLLIQPKSALASGENSILRYINSGATSTRFSLRENGTSGAISMVSQDNVALSIDTSARIHIQPSGNADVELEVSNGASTGGGTVHAATFAAHSSRTLKKDIDPINETDKELLYDDLKSLVPVTFRYKNDPENSDPHKGLVYEDVPDSLKADHQSISLNDQIFMLQAAVQVLIQKVETMEQELEKAGVHP